MAVAALGMTALAMGDLAAALRYLSSAAASFGDYGNISGLFYRFRILLTEALARSGQIEAAVASLEATRQGRHPAYQYVESGYLLASAWVVANQGRTSEAREITLRAAEFARLLAKDCGGAVSPALAAARVPLPFTRREHEIAKLLSHGLSNRDIAEAMSVSVRTVEGHIYQASAKAGVSSRSELATLVQRFTQLEVGSERS